jgi:hypothetical protein
VSFTSFFSERQWDKTLGRCQYSGASGSVGGGEAEHRAVVGWQSIWCGGDGGGSTDMIGEVRRLEGQLARRRRKGINACIFFICYIRANTRIKYCMFFDYISRYWSFKKTFLECPRHKNRLLSSVQDTQK